MNRYPDFYIIGSAKSGTTSLYNLLIQNPQIFMSKIKEPCFFDEQVNWNKGFDWYASLFSGAEKSQICGEASTNYTRWPQVKGIPEKIWKLTPTAKLIYLLRDPVQRTYSHFVHRWTKEVNPGKPFTEDFISFIKKDSMCLDSSKYYMQISKYLEYFPVEQIHFVLFEELVTNPDKVCDEIFSFLNVPPMETFLLKKVKSNVNQEFRYHMMKNRVRDQLIKKPIIKAVIPLLPKSLKNWLYNKIYMKSQKAVKLSAKFDPPKISNLEKKKVYSLLSDDLNQLKDSFPIDTTSWNLCKET